MHEKSSVETMIAALNVGVTRSAQERGIAKLTPLHREVVQGMPQLAEQEVRVLLATLMPGDVTPRHSHRYPVTVFVTEGVFTLELDGRELSRSALERCLWNRPTSPRRDAARVICRSARHCSMCANRTRHSLIKSRKRRPGARPGQLEDYEPSEGSAGHTGRKGPRIEK
jgi:hypothetical protein